MKIKANKIEPFLFSKDNGNDELKGTRRPMDGVYRRQPTWRSHL